MQFNELDLIPELHRGLDDIGFVTCTDVQAETLKYSLAGRDMAVQSQTGTGKTAAFLITIFQMLTTNPKYRGTKALVVAPTRELAVQIETDARALGAHLDLKIGSFYGGVGYGLQEQLIADGVDLIIGTPGRLLDFNKSRKIDFHEVGIIVIDEADRLFDMGFYPDIRLMMRRARPREERMTMLFSATLSVSVRNISWQFMNNPVEVAIAPEQMTVEEVEQELFHVSKDEKFRLLLGILKREQPNNALIFCNTKRATEIVAKKLSLNGYVCEFIIGDLPQKKRLKIINSVKDGSLSMLCATDVAARGLHVNDLELVVNYDLPEDPEAYVHRIGRTARAGKTGKAVSLACERFVYGLEPIQELIGMKIPSSMASDDMLVEDESAGRRLPSTHHYADRPPRRRSGQAGSRPADRRRDTRSPGTGKHVHVPGPKRAASDARGSDPAGHRRTPRPPRPMAAPQLAQSEPGPSRDTSMDERIAYYKKKYGEDFVAKDTKPAAAADSEAKATGDSSHSEAKLGVVGRLFGRKKRS